MYTITGRLQYYDNYCVCYVDDNLSAYYRSLLPKAYGVAPQKYRTHVTVVRKDIESVASQFKENFWKRYENALIPIYYNGTIQRGGSYFWLDAWSPQLNVIRQELGLHPYRFPFNSFHITIGNCK